MDDSDQDFSDLCSRLLKRVRRKNSGEERKTTAAKDEGGPLRAKSGPSQSKAPSKRRKPRNGQLQSSAAGARSQPGRPEDGAPLSAKEKVLRRMARFRRESPARLQHQEAEEGPRCDSAALPTAGDTAELPEKPESDEALALRLQQQLDREAETQAVVDLEDRGLFFCQLCQKDLSAMSPQLRAHHINRCLDESESSTSEAPPSAPPPLLRPRVPECPICGRGFKSDKSRSTHMKRCAAARGVSPAELLQALQRQAAQSSSDGAADRLHQSDGGRKTDSSESGIPATKKARRKGPRMDEDTMVALALSRSLLEQEKEREREMEEERQIQAQLSAPAAAAAPVLHWKPGAGKGRGKRRKGAPAAPPPLLLVQDPQSALNRIQERVSSLLLCPRPPTPPTPELLPSTIPMWTHSTPLWIKSALPGGGPDSVREFYTPELGAFIQPWVGAEKKPSPSSEVTPVKHRPASASETTADPEQPSCAPLCLDQRPAERPSTPACLTPAMSTPGSQALQDLVELAEEGMTLTQYRQTEKEPAVAELPLSGFVPEETKATKPPTSSANASKLCSDLASMVNNPQLSDVQLQVDSGDVYFAHSFMLYARCPLLASMVHDAGFGVQEDGMPAAQRLLLGDVPGEAVYALLQYLYSALCPLTWTVLPHVLQLATRFGLSELQQQCELYSGDPEASNEEGCSADEPNPEPQQSPAETQFLELLRSMWQHEESDGEEFEGGGAQRGVGEQEDDGGTSGDGEMKEDRVDEEELDEIYEFAATQRKMETTRSSVLSEEEDEEGEEEVNDSSGSEKKGAEKQNVEAGQRREASRHSYSVGEDKDAAAMATSAVSMHHTQGSHADVCLGAKSGTHGDPVAKPDVSLDRSYDRLFSESWGEYVEPSPAGISRHHHPQQKSTPAPRPMSSVSEVIDLSISPPPGSEEPGQSSLPVAGVSPGEGASKQSPNTIQPSTLNRIQPALSSPVPLGPAAWSKHSLPGPSKTRPGPSFSLTSSTKPELLSRPCPAAPSPKPSDPKPELSPLVANSIKAELSSVVPNCNQPELIVLSDSSDDMDPDPSVDKVSAQVGASTPSLSPSPPRRGQDYTPIRAKGCMEVGLSSKTSGELERSKTDQPEDLHGPCNQSMLDGSAEVSWLIPATPEASTRTRISMRRTRLFPKSCSSSSSSVPENSEAPRYVDTRSSSLGEKADCSRPRSSECSSGGGSTSGVLEHSPVFQKPASRSRLQSDSLKFVQQPQPSPLPISITSSSTPLHSTLCPKPSECLGSPLLRDSRLRPQGRAAWEEDDEFDEEDAPSLSKRVGAVNPTVSHHKITGLEPSTETSRSPPGEPAHAETKREIADKTGTREKEQRETEAEENMNGVEMTEGPSFYAFDEPPIAFDDSWGLGGGGVGDQGPCFSLRLESSGDPGSTSDHRGQRGETPTSHTLTPPGPATHSTSRMSVAPVNYSLPDPAAWGSWPQDDDDDEDEGPAIPLSQRVGAVAPPKRVAQLKTPVARKNNHVPLVPITPMPGFSDMDTPELKKRLDRFGVRPLPKKQMVLKLKEIHQYTHQVMSSESEEDASPLGRPRAGLSLVPSNLQPAPLSFKQPTAPPPVSPRKLQFGSEDRDALPASQESNTSSTAESERSNPELFDSDDDGSDSEGITASQAAVREKDKLVAVRSFIQSDPVLYDRVLQFQPLSLSELKDGLRAAGIRLGTAKLLDFLDSQCITFTTAKPGHPAPSRRRARARAPAAGPGRAGGRGRKRMAKPAD